MPSIDINCDCGESFGNWKMGNDQQIIPLITTANIACGFHAGDPVTMQRTVDHAHAAGGVVGAHPSLEMLEDGNLAHHTDFRQVYAAVLDQWLGVSSKEVLGKEYKALELFKG